MGNCLSIFQSSGSNPHHEYTPSSPPTMDPSLPTSGDPERPSPFVEPSLPTSEDPLRPSPSTDAIESIRERYQTIDPVEQIGPLVSFIENQLQKMNTPSEAGSSSYDGWLATVEESTHHAATSVNIISTEAEKLSEMDAVKEIGRITLQVLKGVGELRLVFIGLSVAAFVVESYVRVGSMENECRELLLRILELAKDVKQYGEQMSKIPELANDLQISEERGKLCNAVGTIVEGAVLCCDYLNRGKFCRFWSDTTAPVQLEKTNQQLSDLRDSHCFYVALRISNQPTIPIDESCMPLLDGKDVFLSHSGKQKNFVRQLHRDLTREYVSCFFDEDRNSLPLAHKFPPLIFKAAETCKMAVVVLSNDFIRSKWPMLELAAFISAIKSGKNSKLKLLPIFFKISPKELSHITKDSPEWKKMVDIDTRDRWQAALKEVRSINGLHLGENGNEVDCRDKVVKEICCFLKRINPPRLLDFEPVGVEKQVREVKAALDMEGAQSVLAVIVCGFGGVGKSTVAASVVQSLNWSSTDFKFCWVAINENTPDKTSHIVQLQKYIIYKLGGVELDFQNPLEGKLHIKAALKKNCSLLFIDNVVDKNYIRDLLPTDLTFEEQKTKLRILITSREKIVKSELKIVCKEYELNALCDTASERLLFQTIMPSKVVRDIGLDEKRMINEVAAACRGVPLLLTVFGKHLRVARDEDSYQKDKDSYPKKSYEEALVHLRKGNLDSYRDEDLGKTLMFVYDKMKDVEVKEAFLDICTYFHGWEWNLVADIVDFSKLEDLHRRMLVSRSGSGEVIVHDILQLMGVNKANLTRFSDYKKLSDALEDDLDGFDVKYVKGISLVNDNHLIKIQSMQLEAMRHSLRVLMLGDWVTLNGPPSLKAFTNLRYLRVGDITAFPFKDPSRLDNLKVFLNGSKPGMNLSHLPSSLKRISYEVPDVECDMFGRLPFRNLSLLESFIVKARKSVELPDDLHLPASLIYLNLNRCKNLPKDIGHLIALESLILDRSDLERLPEGFGKLKKLKHLSIDYCSKLVFLSEELGMLSSLEELSMKGCMNLRALPESLGGLLSLQTLTLSETIKCQHSECIEGSNLQVLPQSFGELRLQSLKLHSLFNLNELPNSFGNMPLLKDLSIESCHSLMSLPKSFVQLKMLETLKIIKCSKLSVLPEDFGRLRGLKYVTVSECHLLKELPCAFGELPALKTFELGSCNSFVNLPKDFPELTSLEELSLSALPLISLPDGFGKLKKLRFLDIQACCQLKTLTDDFENMASLERLTIQFCVELDGAMMEKILKLQNCYIAYIYGSTKLSEKWEHIQGETAHPIVVLSGVYEDTIEDRGRAIRVALLHGKCIEVNNATHQLMERTSLFVGSEEGINATVALIMLPIRIESHQHQTLERFVEMARERAKTNGSGKLQIVCARKVDLYADRPTRTEEEERAEEEGIRQILLLLPKGSCVIPSSEFKREKIIRWGCNPYSLDRDKLSFFIANEGLDMEGRKVFENMEFYREHEISGNVVMKPPASEIRKAENKLSDSIQKFIKSNQAKQSECVAGESKTREFMEALEGNGIHYLIIPNSKSKVVVDDLCGRAIGFIICHFKFLEDIKLQQLYKDLQQKDSNFIGIWIPTVLPKDCGYGSYTRLIQCMPWATFPHPQLFNIESRGDRFVVLDKHGQIANPDALPLLMGWGVESYPFTQHTIPKSFSFAESESCLEFLLHGMNIVGRKPMRSKMTFLYAESPSECEEIKCKLEELTQISGSFEVLYVGRFDDLSFYNTEDLKQVYEDETQKMCWPSLSFSDMMMFWYRCKYLTSDEGYELCKQSDIRMETVHRLVRRLYYSRNACLALVDNNGPVTCHGYEVLQMICESSDEISEGEGMAVRMVKDELTKSLSRGECTPLVKTFFRDEIHNHPQHPQHPISYLTTFPRLFTCGVCLRLKILMCDGERSYRCYECAWFMCGNCWMTCAKQEVELLAIND